MQSTKAIGNYDSKILELSNSSSVYVVLRKKAVAQAKQNEEENGEKNPNPNENRIEKVD